MSEIGWSRQALPADITAAAAKAGAEAAARLARARRGAQGSGQQEDDEADQRRELHDPDDLQDIREGLFARLVPEQRAARERADRAAQPREHQEVGLADPPLPRRRLRLVDPERGKGRQIHGREPDDDICGRDQRKPIHARGISRGLVEEGFAGSVLRRRCEAPNPRRKRRRPWPRFVLCNAGAIGASSS